MFSPEQAASLPGPDWLRRDRVAAAERLADLDWPTTEEEVWRYSRIDELDPERFSPPAVAEKPSGDLVLEPDPWRPATDPVVADVVVVDGWVRSVDVDPGWSAKGLEVTPLVDADGAGELLGEVGEAGDAFAELHRAFMADPLLVRVPPGLAVDGVVHVRNIVTDHSGGALVCPRLVVSVGENATLAVVEHHQSGESDALAVPVTEAHVGQAGRLGHVVVQDLGAATWQVGHQVLTAGQDAQVASATAGLGGDYARLRTDCRLDGRGATGALLAAYFGEGDQMLDFRTFQDHRAPDTTSNLLFKGAVAGHSRSVYTGLIRVRPEARGTNAFQTNRNVKLSDGAWAESVPNLQIENNDVRCSHASAVGPIDEEQRFYLESRGVPPLVADRLVVAGFFDEVITQLPVAGSAAPLRAAIAAKLDRREAQR